MSVLRHRSNRGGCPCFLAVRSGFPPGRPGDRPLYLQPFLEIPHPVPGWNLIRAWKSHNLIQLAREVRELTEDEQDLLERLTIFVTWAGRYPMPWTPDTYISAAEKGVRRVHMPEDAKLAQVPLQRPVATLDTGTEQLRNLST